MFEVVRPAWPVPKREDRSTKSRTTDDDQEDAWIWVSRVELGWYWVPVAV